MDHVLLTDGREERLDLDADLRAPLSAPLLGWVRKPHGWCRDDACVPAAAARAAEDDRGVDVVAFAELTGKVAAVDRDERVIALADAAPMPPGGRAPDFTLDGRSLSEFRGRKVALVFWASWCGCRYDLPAWEERHRALEPSGLTVVSVACDRDPAQARPWQSDLTHPALVDADGIVAERYNVINVPTVVWIDEEGRIARPQDTQTATDLFRSMNGIDSEASLAALRRWVAEGDRGLTDAQIEENLRVPTREEQRARAHARLAVWLAREGRADAAARHLARAAELAPHDVAIRRGLMPLVGTDPFGDAYFALREELRARGIPVYRPLNVG
ncbi:TlpA disulfide reductase family protein [Actinomadura sp. DC4]|uniref:TlpA disulfide reductase family protein n=1 Tax=Actinomadura sp. DC4 TaxID=3055069 RepID=UPI00339D913A